jgi:hypothetical protein
VSTPPPVGNKTDPAAHLMGGHKTGGMASALNNDQSLYNGTGKLSEKTDILSQKSQT